MKRSPLLVLPLVLSFVLGYLVSAEESPKDGAHVKAVESQAIRTKNMKAMEAFYAAAFGAKFTDNQLGPFKCRFGKSKHLLIKLVPLRDAVDFKGYPIHQLGVEVRDAKAFVALAEKHGGKAEGPIRPAGKGWVGGALRDPDGNTIEFRAPAK